MGPTAQGRRENQVGLCEATLVGGGFHSTAALHVESPGCINWQPYPARKSTHSV